MKWKSPDNYSDDLVVFFFFKAGETPTTPHPNSNLHGERGTEAAYPDDPLQEVILMIWFEVY